MYQREIKYNKETRQYDCFLDGEWLFDAPTYQDGETRLDELVFELLSGQYFRESA